MEYKKNLLIEVLPAVIAGILGSLICAKIFALLLIVLISSAIAVLYKILQWRNYRVEVYDNRVIVRYGVITRHSDCIRIEKIQKIRISRSVKQLLFKNTGTVVLEGGNDIAVELKNIQDYKKLSEETLIRAGLKDADEGHFAPQSEIDTLLGRKRE